MPVWIASGGVLLVTAGAAVLLRRFYRAVDSGTALVISSPGRTRVTFTGAVVYPMLARAEVVDLTTKMVRLSRKDADALLTRDEARAEIEIVFYVRVNRSAEDVLKVAQTFGPERTRDDGAVDELFRPIFTSAAIDVVRKLAFVELDSEREKVADEITVVVGRDLNGYVLDKVAVEHVGRAPAMAAGPFR